MPQDPILLEYGADHLETMTFVQKITKNKKKNPEFISSWENAPFNGPERSPRGIKFKLKIDGENFCIPTRFAQSKGTHIYAIVC